MKVINLKNFGVVVFNTKLTKIAIEKLTKHNPDALKLKDEEGNDIFALAFGKTASISEYGVCFDKEDSEGKALITLSGIMENKEIAEEYAKILINIKKIEEQAVEAYRILERDLANIVNSIENPLEIADEEVQNHD